MPRLSSWSPVLNNFLSGFAKSAAPAGKRDYSFLNHSGELSKPSSPSNIPADLCTKPLPKLLAEALTFLLLSKGCAKHIRSTIQFVDAWKNPLLNHFASAALRPFIKVFLGGETIAEGVKTARVQVNLGARIIFDLLDVESTASQPEAAYDKVLELTKESIDKLAQEFDIELKASSGSRTNIAVAVKVMSLGNINVLTDISKKLRSAYTHAVLSPEEEKNFIANLSVQEKAALDAAQTRLNTICQLLKEKRIKCVIDKESFDQNPLIDFMTGRSIRADHTGFLMTTAQSIRSNEEMKREQRDIQALNELSISRQKDPISLKVVKGAYVNQDREINPNFVTSNYEQTHTNFLNQLKNYSNIGLAELVVASHNGECLVHAHNVSQENPGPTEFGRATLLGMYPRPDQQCPEARAKALKAMPRWLYLPAFSDEEKTLIEKIIGSYADRRLDENRGESGNYGFQIRMEVIRRRAIQSILKAYGV